MSSPVRRPLEEGRPSKDSHDTVVRFAPPLVATNTQLDVAVAALARVLGRLRRPA